MLGGSKTGALRQCSLLTLASTAARNLGRSSSSLQVASQKKEVINKEPISMVMTDRLYSYLLQHTREPDILRRLREETSTLGGARMQISPEQGAFMALLVKLLGVQRYVEVGVFTGYSSLAVALALPPTGTLVALDRDPAPVDVAKRYWEEAGVAGLVDCRVAPAADSLRDVLDQYGAGSFDMAFIDADKRGYRAYYESLLGLVKKGGLIAIDNVLWYGRVADPAVDDKATVAIRELNEFLLTDERIDLSIVPVGDGIALCRKK